MIFERFLIRLGRRYNFDIDKHIKSLNQARLCLAVNDFGAHNMLSLMQQWCGSWKRPFPIGSAANKNYSFHWKNLLLAL